MCTSKQTHKHTHGPDEQWEWITVSSLVLAEGLGLCALSRFHRFHTRVEILRRSAPPPLTQTLLCCPCQSPSEPRPVQGCLTLARKPLEGHRFCWQGFSKCWWHLCLISAVRPQKHERGIRRFKGSSLCSIHNMYNWIIICYITYSGSPMQYNRQLSSVLLH